MKTSKINKNTSPSKSSKLFFDKSGEGSFFAAGKEESVPFFQGQFIQKSLSMGTPNDPFEQEADKISRQVMDNFDKTTSLQGKLPGLGIQSLIIQPLPIGTRISRMVQNRQNISQSKCKNCEQDKMKVQPKALRIQSAGEGGKVLPDIEQRINSHRGGGQSLDTQTRTAMESSFGADFSSIKVHTDTSAIQMSQELNSHAFTVGSDIFFNKGRYQPKTKEGAGLLAHELTHTIQQGGAVQNKRINKNTLSSILSMHSMAHLSAMNEKSISSKEMTQLQNLPEEELMQQKEIFESNEVDKVQKKDSRLSLRRCIRSTKKQAKLKSGPTYSPNGTLNATLNADGKKYSPPFTMAAEFENDPSNNIHASCGEVRQYIKWSNSTEIPNHADFKPASNFSANTWYEDRFSGNKRYGHRSGISSFQSDTNNYKDSSGSIDMLNGPIFHGWDRPMDGSGSKTGTWDFKIEAIDTNNGNKVLGTDNLTVDW